MVVEGGSEEVLAPSALVEVEVEGPSAEAEDEEAPAEAEGAVSALFGVCAGSALADGTFPAFVSFASPTALASA